MTDSADAKNEEGDAPVDDKAAPSASDAKGDETGAPAETPAQPRKEIGGRGGPDPTRYGDWEINGRCVDF